MKVTCQKPEAQLSETEFREFLDSEQPISKNLRKGKSQETIYKLSGVFCQFSANWFLKSI